MTTLLHKPLLLAASAAVLGGTLVCGPAITAPALAATSASTHAVQAHTLHINKLVNGNGAIWLRWNAVRHANNYHVQVSTARTFKSHTTRVVKKADMIFGHLKNAQRYYIRVVAYHGNHRLVASNVVQAKPTKNYVAPSKPTPEPTSTPTLTPKPTPVANGINTTLAAGLTGVPAGGAAQLKTGTYSFNDFTAFSGTAGYDVPASVAKIQGAGKNATVLQMTPHSSTRGSQVPTGSGTTNQLSELVLHGTSVSDLTLQGTDQGHPYNGIRVHRANNTRITNVKVAATPGNKNYPPGETFGINDYRTNGSIYNNIEVDGAGVGAAGFGGNNSENIQITNAWFHNNPYSAGITFWQSHDITLTDVKSTDNHGGFNFERDAGTINIVRPAWSSIGNKHAFSFNSDQASAKVNIYDPVLPAGTNKIYILVAKSYLGAPNKQLKSDIHVYQHGEDVTGSLVVFAG